MKAAQVAGKERIELVEVPEPRGEDGKAVVRVLQCGICGSDLHAYRGEWGGSGFALGHEFCGVVEQVGRGGTSSLVGQRVCSECFGHCGQCEYCHRGDYNLCTSMRHMGGSKHGALAEKVAMPASSLFVLPESLSDVQGMMVEPLAVAFRAVSRAQVHAGETVAVIGGGTIGLLCGAVAVAKGAAKVLLFARYEHQAQMATRLGVHRALLPGDDDPQVTVNEATAGAGVDVVLDTVAREDSLSTALALACRKGTVVELGGITGPLQASLGPLVSRELRLLGSSCYAFTEGRKDFAWAIELIESGRIAPELLVTHTFPLSQVQEAFATANDKKTGSIKVAVAPERP